MKGYKGTDEHMKCRGMQYEVGKTYHADGDINVCFNGLHFCERLTDVFDYYNREGNRFFEVDASGTVKTEGRKSASSDLKIIRELDDIEINRIVYGYGDGWEEVLTEETFAEAKQRKKEYIENMPQYPYKIVKRRVRK